MNDNLATADKYVSSTGWRHWLVIAATAVALLLLIVALLWIMFCGTYGAYSLHFGLQSSMGENQGLLFPLVVTAVAYGVCGVALTILGLIRSHVATTTRKVFRAIQTATLVTLVACAGALWLVIMYGDSCFGSCGS